MKNIKSWLLSAFDVNTVGGASARKLSAFWMVMLVTSLELTYTIKCFNKDKELIYLPEMVYADLAFAATALGLTLMDKIKKKDEAPDNNSDSK